jgi:hypothetical protein
MPACTNRGTLATTTIPMAVPIGARRWLKVIVHNARCISVRARWIDVNAVCIAEKFCHDS